MAASAVTVEVSTLSELQAAIDAAQDGDVIGLTATLEIQSDISIGSPDKHVTIRRMNPSTFIQFSGFNCNVQIKNITFDGNNLEAMHNFLKIYCNVIFEKVNFINSISTGSGGAMYISSNITTFKDCMFDNNKATNGGHIAMSGDANVTLRNCTMKNGSASSQGGAIHLATNSSTCYVINSIISENTASDFGGGVANNGVLVVEGSKIFKNTAAKGGADIGNYANVTLEQDLEVLKALYADEHIIVKGWVSDFTDESGATFLKLDFELPAPTPTAVILDSASLGTAGDGKITGLTSGKKYKVSVDGTTSYVKTDGTLTSLESESGTLTGTEIVGLTNGKTYKVEEYTPVPTPDPNPTPVDPTPTPTPDPTPVTPPSSNNNSSGGSSHSHYTPIVTTVTQPETKKVVVLSYGKAVLDTTKTEYLIGYTDGMLGGKDTLTKAQFVQIVYRLLTPESRTAVYSDKSNFKDVASSAWYYEAVNSMTNAGLISVGADGKFNPDKNVTWGEMVNILAKFAKPNSEWKIITKHWAKDSLNTAISNRWFEYNDQFNPDGEVTRLEMLNFINTMFKWSKQ